MDSIGGHRTVFLAGNFEAQRIAGCYNKQRKELRRATLLTIRNHFIFSCLISDFVIQPYAHYHQSPITQWLTKKYEDFFKPYKSYPPIALYAVSYRKGTYKDDAAEKAGTYTSNFRCYKDPEIRNSLTRQLDKLADPFIRKGKLANSLSDIILNASKENGELFKFVHTLTGDTNDTKKILYPLREISKEQKKALIPEYLKEKVVTKTPNSFFKFMRLSLLESYTQIVGGLYDAYPHNALYPYYIEVLFPYKLNHLDTHLFHYFLRIIPQLDEIITNSTPSQILALKYSERFLLFIGYYRKFIENLKGATMNDFKRLVLKDIKIQENIYNKKLEDLLTNPSLINLLHESIADTIGSRIITNSNIFFSYHDVPIFSLVSEVMERFTGRYENRLKTTLCKSEYSFISKPSTKNHVIPSQSVSNTTVGNDLVLIQTIYNYQDDTLKNSASSSQTISDSQSGRRIVQKSNAMDSEQQIVNVESVSTVEQIVTSKEDISNGKISSKNRKR